MTFIEWTNAMSVHDADMDCEHREIVDLVNKLYLDVRNAQPPQTIERHLAALAEIIDSHFVHEEKLMKASSYGRFDEHQRAHASMSHRTAEFLARYRLGEAAMTMNQVQFIKAWLCTHIQDADNHFSAHLAGTECSPVRGFCAGHAVRR